MMSDPKKDPWTSVIAGLADKHHLPDLSRSRKLPEKSPNTLLQSSSSSFPSTSAALANNNNNNNSSSHRRRNENDHVNEVERWLKEPVPGQSKDNNIQQNFYLLLADLLQPLDTEAACKALHLGNNRQSDNVVINSSIRSISYDQLKPNLGESLENYRRRLKHVIAGALPEVPVNGDTSPALLLPFLQLPARISQRICVTSENLLSLDCLAGCFYGIEQAEKQLQQQRHLFTLNCHSSAKASGSGSGSEKKITEVAAAAAAAGIQKVVSSQATAVPPQKAAPSALNVFAGVASGSGSGFGSAPATLASRLNTKVHVKITTNLASSVDYTCEDIAHLRLCRDFSTNSKLVAAVEEFEYYLKAPLYADDAGRAYHLAMLMLTPVKSRQPEPIKVLIRPGCPTSYVSQQLVEKYKSQYSYQPLKAGYHGKGDQLIKAMI